MKEIEYLDKSVSRSDACFQFALVNRFSKGGAANCCVRLGLGLRDIGCRPLLITENGAYQKGFVGYSGKQWLLEENYINNLRKQIVQLLRYRQPRRLVVKTRHSALEKLSFPESSYALSRMQSDLQLDLIHLHWVAGLIDYKEFFKNVKIPVVWTLHDMSPFTGGLHYDEKIVGVDNHGNLRFDKPHSKFNDYVRKMHKHVKQCCSMAENLVIVSPSKWLAEEAKKSGSFDGRKIEVVPYGIDERVFRQRERGSFRNIMGTDMDKLVFLFVADSFMKARKGGIFISLLLKHFPQEEFEIWIVGGSVPDEIQADSRIRQIGFVEDEILLSILYSASDFTLVFSLQDNFPNTVLESLMCGTPVVAFPVGGIPEILTDNRSGLLIREVSINALLNCIDELFKKIYVFDRDWIRNDAVAKYSLGIQAKRYLDIYTDALR